jgi:fructoselysine 6-kinase
MNIACFSVACVDYFPQVERWFVGGNALNQTIHFRRLGHHTAMVGAIGDDTLGEHVLGVIGTEGVDATSLHRLSGATASNRLRVDAAGERFEDGNSWVGGVYGEYRLNEADWSFLDGFDLWSTHGNMAQYDEALARKRAHTRMVVDFLHLPDLERMERSCGMVDILYSGGGEALAEDLAQLSANTGQLIILTLGADGSIAFHGSRVFRQPALPLAKVVDTTGCGDAFQAACTDTFFRNGDVAQSLLAGAEAGRRTASHWGALGV